LKVIKLVLIAFKNNVRALFSRFFCKEKREENEGGKKVGNAMPNIHMLVNTNGS